MPDLLVDGIVSPTLTIHPNIRSIEFSAGGLLNVNC